MASSSAAPASPPRKAVEALPRAALIGIGLVLLATLVTVAALRLTRTTIHNPDAAATASRALRFEDGPGGSVLVIDAASGRQAASFSGEQGFLRGTLRALAHERKRIGAGSEKPFDLTLHADNRLTLSDPLTGQRIDLESFGPTNAGLFARLLKEDGTPQPGPMRPVPAEGTGR